MEKLFLTILSMSGTASVVILLVLLVRLLLRKAPKAFSFALWAVVLFRLLCPFSIPTSWSLTPRVQVKPAEEYGDLLAVSFDRMEIAIAVDDVPAGRPEGGAAPAGPSDASAVPAPDASAQTGSTRPGLWTVLSAVWLAGAALLLGYSLISLLLLRRRLVGSVPLAGEKNVRLADHIPSPFVLGLARPRIYLPSGLPEGERDYILLHERTHIRRFDHVSRALAWLALAVHWFNPLVWLAFHLAGRDMEMSCDETVLKRMGRDVRADYSSSLLRLSQGGRLPAGPLAFGGGDPQHRIKHVLRYKKPALWAVAAGLLVVLTACTALATSRAAQEPDPAQTSALSLEVLAEGLDADLVVNPDQREDGTPFVRISGTIGGTALSRAIWYPEDADYLFGPLTMEYDFASGGANISAGWADEGRTSVTVSTKPSAAFSSLHNAGYWEFTVDLSTGGSLAEMHDPFPGDESVMYPGSITDAEAIQAARIAAVILWVAEDYYTRNPPETSGPAPSLAPTYSLNETGVLVSGLDCDGAVWVEDTGYSRFDPRLGLPESGMLGLLSISNPRFLGGRFAEADGSAVAAYYPYESDPLVFVGFDDHIPADNDIGWDSAGTGTYFTVDLVSGAATLHPFYGSEGADLAPGLSDTELKAAARTLARLIQGAADFYADAGLPQQENPLPFHTPIALMFASGAGAWRTNLLLNPDGSFSGRYTDADLHIQYVCDFHGQFGDIEQVSDASWSMTLEELVLDTGHPIGEEWDDPGDTIHYISSAPYGLDGKDGQPLKPGAQFMFYTPEASGRPGGELYGMENSSSELYEFWTWWPSRFAISGGEGSTLGCYALRSAETGRGFFDLHEWGIN